jgi:hypothetical protein
MVERAGLPLTLPELSFAPDEVFVSSKFLEGHRAASVKFVGADANLGAESKLRAISETGRSVPIDRCRIHFIQKFFRIGSIRGDDAARIRTCS